MASYDTAAIQAKYPFLAYLIDDPEIGALLREAYDTDMPPDTFQGRLMATNWYRTHSDAMRRWDALLQSDPETAHTQHAAEMAKISDQAKQIGLNLTHDQLHYFALDALRFGWSETQIQDNLVAFIGNYPGGEARAAPGTFATTLASIRQLNSQYLMPDDGGQEGGAFNFAKQILSGEMTLDGLQELMRDTAIRLHPQWREALDKGQTMQQILQPYAQEIGNILGLTNDQIDWSKDLRFKELVDFRDPATGEVRQPSLAEIEKRVKTDARYAYDTSKNGREEAAQMASTFLSKMGLA